MACLPCRLLRLKSRRVPTSTNEVVVANATAGDHGDHEIVKHEGGGGDSVARKYDWDEIERMTMNFSRVIGSGGFSRVYLARLPTLAAIKVPNGPSRHFKQELNIQRCLDHENIVKLLGYSVNNNNNGQDQIEEEGGGGGCLVFEYVSNGSLQDRLHGRHGDQSNSRWHSSSSSVLSWKRRMAIAFQLAQALEYLHEKCALPVVHGDIKASNILLDEHLNCKLCDFGFATTGFASTVIPSSGPRRTKQVMMGSPGYTDPHFLRTGIPSKKNDVYSYGVVVLELVTGMEAFCEERERGHQLLASLMGPTLSAVDRLAANEVARLVDPRLQAGGGEAVDVEEARAMLYISALCLAEHSTLRPSAAQILRAIESNIHSISSLFLPQARQKQFKSQIVAIF